SNRGLLPTLNEGPISNRNRLRTRPLRTVKDVDCIKLMLRSLPVPGQPALQFFDDKGDVIWTVPQAPILRPVK
ncbi:MAG TPA: hypothetical protein VKD23_15100, partial [Terriglobales bacterium]|nr:hypothetical protein [Terriglobales bacterium]